MTRAERLFVQRVERRAAQLEPRLSREFLRAMERIRGQLTERQLAQLLETRGAESLFADELSGEVLEREMARFRAQLQEVQREATRLMQREVPGILRQGTPDVPIAFGVLNPNVLEAVRQLDTKVMQTLTEAVRETVRAEVARGFEAGQGPFPIARRIRESVGLAPHQARAVDNFRAALTEGRIADALRYKLRDRRFALREGMSPEHIERAVAAYRRRMLAFHADTVARTAAVDALKAGHRLNWEEAIRQGIVERARVHKEWIAVAGPAGDGRNRPHHLDMHGTVVGFDDTWNVEGEAAQMVPGDGEWNCRCLARYFVIRAARREAA